MSTGISAKLSRRHFLISASALALTGPVLAQGRAEGRPRKVRPLPLNAVRLKPSVYLDAVEANRRYLLALDPGRLLHNFHKSAGLPPQGEVYGGWEARGIAGHSLGHYLSACSLMFAQTGDAEVRGRIRTIVAELARCQSAHGDGYVGGTTVERDGEVIDGKIVFEEIGRGEIRTSGFDINGGWVPLYTWHKVHAGLIDAYRTGGIAEAMPVMLGMADYLAVILEGLSEEQMQRLLAAEHGGLNDSHAQTYELTGNRRYLALAERIRHRQVLDPLAEGRDNLQGLHANTQIPKVIGLARLHDVAGAESHRETARFFHRTVLDAHSYVIGGNSEREHFGPPYVLSPRITDRTCEACNTYNMLLLTRHIYAWEPQAAHFDYYERAHLNHIMAHQHPRTGAFVYFMPMNSGGRRTYSTPDDSFWCCVGTGMESHSKHGDSIYWEDGESLYVNLFIPSTLDWRERGTKLEIDTSYPFSEQVTLRFAEAPAEALTVKVRLPGWCAEPALEVNGDSVPFERRDGYALLRRWWQNGDTIALRLPMRVAVEATPDDPKVLAFVHGPVVLAADLGPADEPFAQPRPALITADVIGQLEPVDRENHLFRANGALPQPLMLAPFFRQYDRRTAVYFPRFSEAEWARERTAFERAEAERRALEDRTIDVVFLGEMQPERDHAFRTNHSDLLSQDGRSGRQAWWGVGNYFEVELAVRDVPVVLRALYWGEEVDKDFEISVDGTVIARERRQAEPVRRFVAQDYPIPEALLRGKARIVVRIETRGSDAPVYELRTLTAASQDGPSI